jgi:hypothetical protein
VRFVPPRMFRINRLAIRRSLVRVSVAEPNISWWVAMMNRMERMRAKRVASLDMPSSVLAADRRGRDLNRRTMTIVRRSSTSRDDDDDDDATLRFCQCQQCQASPLPFIDMI